MLAPWLRARADLRQRWGSVVALVVVAGVAGGFALTALLGARQSATAWERFRAETRADDAFVAIPSRPDPEVADELARMPGVVDATSFVYLAVTLPGVAEGGAFAAADDRFLRTVQRGRLIDGRRSDPSRASEVVVNPAMAAAARVRVGEKVTLEGVGESGFSKPVTVVGVVLTANDLALNTGFPAILLTAAFYKAHAHEVDAGRVNQFVRLERGPRGIPAFRDRVTARFGDGGAVLVGNSDEEAGGIKNALRLQATALALLGAVAAAAAVVAVGQALARQVTDAATDNRVLRGLGMTSGQRALASLGPVFVVSIAGGLLAMTVAWAASPLVPTGLARQVESDTGFKFDAVVMGGGAVTLGVLLVACGYGAARRAAQLRSTRPSGHVGGAFRTPLSAPAGIGLATALGRGNARTRVAARSATAAALVGAVGVTAAATFATSLDHLLDTPRLYGWNFDAVVGVGGDDASRIDEALSGLAQDPDVERLAAPELSFLTIGEETVETFVLDQRKGAPILPTLAGGRAPSHPEELILGATTMALLRVGLGDVVDVAGSAGPVRMRVVGQGIFPVMGEGTTTHAAAIPAPAASGLRLEASRGRLALVGVRPGTDPIAVIRKHTDLPASVPTPPSEVKNLQLVESAPWLLAAFLAALATIALAHALVVCVRAGRRDIAVLRTLGFVRRQVHATIRWQASATMAIGLVAGVPIGVAVGRWIWRLSVENTGALVEPVTTASLLATLFPLVLLLASVTSWVPARRAAGMRPAEILRVE